MQYRNVGPLLDVIAVDVRNRLSNKHSMMAPFVPSNLVKLLSGYARTQHISSASSSMLDAAAGSVVRRMTAGHLNAVTKLSDLSQLLQAYASLGHSSTVVVPELLNAASTQVSHVSTQKHHDSPEQQAGINITTAVTTSPLLQYGHTACTD